MITQHYTPVTDRDRRLPPASPDHEQSTPSIPGPGYLPRADADGGPQTGTGTEEYGFPPSTPLVLRTALEARRVLLLDLAMGIVDQPKDLRQDLDLDLFSDRRIGVLNLVQFLRVLVRDFDLELHSTTPRVSRDLKVRQSDTEPERVRSNSPAIGDVVGKALAVSSERAGTLGTGEFTRVGRPLLEQFRQVSRPLPEPVPGMIGGRAE